MATKASILASKNQTGDASVTNFGTSFANIDTSTLKADVPNKGTYMIYVNATFGSVGANATSVRLWNNTSSAVVANSYRYVAKNDNGTGENATECPTGLLWKVTVTEATTFYLQGKSSADTQGFIRGIAGNVGYEMGYFSADI